MPIECAALPDLLLPATSVWLSFAELERKEFQFDGRRGLLHRDATTLLQRSARCGDGASGEQRDPNEVHNDSDRPEIGLKACSASEKENHEIGFVEVESVIVVL